MLAITVLQACGTLPDAARLVSPDEMAAKHDVWVAAPQPPCPLPLPPLYVYEASPAERAALCHMNPPPGACLARVTTRPMRQVSMAVVPPEDPEAALAHEATHFFEACALGAYDHGHTGPQWSRENRKKAGIR